MKKETEEVTRKDEEKNKKGKEERRWERYRKNTVTRKGKMEKEEEEGGCGRKKIKRGVREEKRTME